MKKINTWFWVSTGLFAAFMILSAVPDIMLDPIAVQGIHRDLGYPVYFIPFIGVAKLLGAIAILIPKLKRLKEWAYAGLFFDLIAATFSIIAVGKPDWLFMILPLALAVTSYVLYRKKERYKLISGIYEQEETLKIQPAFK